MASYRQQYHRTDNKTRSILLPDPLFYTIRDRLNCGHSEATGVLSHTTAATYARRVIAYLNWLGESKPLANVRTFQLDAIRAWIDHLYQSHTSNASLRQHVRALIAYIRAQRFEGTAPTLDYLLSLSPSLPSPKGTRTGNWLTVEQSTRLLRTPDTGTVLGLRDSAILAVLIGCGLRRDELTRLTWEVLDFRNDRPIFLNITGKGNKTRTVPIPEWVYTRIEAWQAFLIASGCLPVHVQSHAASLGIKLDLHYPIFCALPYIHRDRYYRSQLMSTSSIWLLVKRYAKLAGLPDLAPHDLRRTCAKLLRNAGGELDQIQALLGHSSVRTTQRYVGDCQELGKGKAVTDLLNL